MRFILTALLLTALTTAARAITTGQIPVQVYNGTGFTTTYVTIVDGQVIGKTAGVPAAITLGALAELNAIGSAQITDGTIALADISAAAMSTGGAASDAGKIVRFEAGGALYGYGNVRVIGTSWLSYLSSTEVAWSDGTYLARLQAPSSLSENVIWVLPGESGTLVGTGDTGTVTNAMLAGSIDLTSKVTGALPIANGGTGLTMLGTGVATFLATPSSANLAGALTDETGTGSVVLSASPTLSGTFSVTDGSGHTTFSVSPSTVQVGWQSGFGTGTSTHLWYGAYGVLYWTQYGTNSWVASRPFGCSERFTIVSADGSKSAAIELKNDTSGFLRQMAGSTAQCYGVYNTSTDDTHWESGVLDWQTTANTLRIGSDVGSAGGTARDVSLIFGGTEKARLASGGFVIGASGAAISKVLTGTATLDFDLTAAVVADLTLTVTGAAVGDAVVLGVPAGSVTSTAQYTAWVSASNTVTVRCRTSATGEDPASGTFRTTIIQH